MASPIPCITIEQIRECLVEEISPIKDALAQLRQKLDAGSINPLTQIMDDAASNQSHPTGPPWGPATPTLDRGEGSVSKNTTAKLSSEDGSYSPALVPRKRRTAIARTVGQVHAWAHEQIDRRAIRRTVAHSGDLLFSCFDFFRH